VTKKETRPEGREGRDPARKPLSLEVDGLSYSLAEAPRKSGRKVVATVRRDSGEGSALTDRVDLYSYRQRTGFATLVADAFSKTTDTVLGHLAVLLDQIERASPEKKAESVVLGEDRKKAAEELLKAPDLLDRAASAIEALGYVGEARNKRLAYLVATSRLLEKPLSAILRAPSGAGKSELLEKTAELIPEESVEYLSRLTSQSLYYLGQDYLRHKLVLVDEQAGATDADYSIRTLQSKGLLRLATVVKGKTEPFTVNGPVALMSSTTDSELNPENLSRCLELTLDDSPEQTRLIQEAQRRAWTGVEEQAVDTQTWKDAQRLLEPCEVTIPFAPELTFPTRTTKDRRDNAKLGTLISTHALLFQRQREKDQKGRVVATLEDYRAVFALFAPLVEAELEDLSPRASAVYRVLSKRRKESLTRRELAQCLGWSYTTTRRALDELVSHELATLDADEDSVRRYRILDDVPLGTATGLRAPQAISAQVPMWQSSGKGRQGSGRARGNKKNDASGYDW